MSVKVECDIIIKYDKKSNCYHSSSIPIRIKIKDQDDNEEDITDEIKEALIDYIQERRTKTKPIDIPKKDKHINISATL